MNPFRLPLFGDFGLAITVVGLKAQLDMLDPSTPLVVELDSEGGSVNEAVAIFNVLRTWPAGVDVEIVGWALSAATVVAMAGRTIRAHETALLMVHAPWLQTAGNADALRQRADVLDQVAETMRTAYRRTRQADAVIKGWLDGADHWFTAQEAKAVGLVDEVITNSPHAATHPDVRACRFQVPQPLQQRMFAMSPQQHPAPANGAHDAAALAAGARAEAARRDELDGVFAHYRQRYPSTALDGVRAICLADMSCTVQAAKLKILDALAVGVGPVAGVYVATEPGQARGTSQIDDYRAAATDVLLARAGIKVKDPHPAVVDLQRTGIVGMASALLSLRGVSVSNKSGPEIISAALSTSDFPALLANVGGKALRAGYETSPATFIGWTGEREVADFKSQSLVSLSEAPGLLKVGEGAEYKSGKFDESAAPFKVETFGRVVDITRQALINDDLSAFTRMPQAFGAAARRLEADLVYALLTSNPVLSDGVVLFHATHGNLGAASAITVDSLGVARAAMRKQKGLQGLGYVDPQPAYLIVPVALETQAEQLLSSLVDPSKNNATPTNEWIVRGLTLVADPRLDADSATKWYLSAAPTQIEGVIRAYISGEDRPYFEESSEFKRDALSFKSRLDVCAGIVDHRALFRNG